ncbi:hypothetical protein [Methanolobus psychrotolerans]|uniref:hypothetical protein n=1 Tax=Methanolobus psychrotolerans TaxID=1874706 RepID=UPI0013EDB48F|nr:hypothetical protein [Methanolobus psychrotolerans]
MQFSRTIIEYANHPEAKFDGEIRILERKNTEADKPLTQNSHVMERLEMWENA